MKYNVRKIIFLLALIFGLIATLWFKGPIQFQSSLNDLLPLPQQLHKIPHGILQKYTNAVNVMIESDTFQDAKQRADSIYQELLQNNFAPITYHIPEDILNTATQYFKDNGQSFLSNLDRDYMLNNQFDKVTTESINFVTTSFTPLVLPLDKDPFTLTTRYMTGLLQPTMKWQEKQGVLTQQLNDKHYILITLSLNTNDLPQTIKQIHLLQQIVRQFETVYVTGSPIHTTTMYQKSKIEIALLTTIAAVMLGLLSFLLLKKIHLIISVVFNLLIAFVSGFWIFILFSNSAHLLTLVFGSSLLGICIDYSFHKMASGTKHSTNKNILYSLITTLCCFIPLLISGINILNQIALFMMGGLLGTYLWISFAQSPTHPIDTTMEKMHIPPLIKKSIIYMFILATLIGLGKLKFENNLNSFYTPKANLAMAERLFHQLNGTTFENILIIHGKTTQEVLEKQEALKPNHSFFSLSDILPSIKRQTENQQLIQQLYQKEAANIQHQLGLKNPPKFTPSPLITPTDFTDKFGTFLWNQTMIQDNKSFWSLTPIPNDIVIQTDDTVTLNLRNSMKETLDTYTHQTYLLLMISMGILLCFLIFIYRKKTALYIIPSALSILGTLAILSLCHISISFFHALTLFIVLGLSIDYTIFHFSNDKDTFKPVLFSFLSSTIGFGLLSFASFNMIANMGFTLLIGLTLAYGISFIMAENVAHSGKHKIE